MIMASYLDKMQVNTAITDSTKLDLGHQHITTADFMQLNVATMMELVPGTKIDFNMESFARLNPLVVPTFGRASLNNRCFFVPFRTIFRGWNDFITDSVHIASDGYSGGGSQLLLPNVPIVKLGDLRNAFLNAASTLSPVVDPNTGYAPAAVDPNALVYQHSVPPVPSMYDFIYSTNYYSYTVKGRQCLKTLEALGYKLDWSGDKDTVFSAMPLLALAKVYCDWYFPQQYSNISVYDNLLSICNMDVSAGVVNLTATQVALILTACAYVQYDSDLFVSAWDQPNQPNASNYSDFKLVNIDSVGSYMYGNSSVNYSEEGYITNNSGSAATTNRIGGANAPFITPYISTGSSNSSGVTPISEYLLHGLHALTDYMKRHQLAGSRAFDRYLARFGKALPAEKMNRCLYLGAHNQDIQIGDIMSTADTSATGGDQLGMYAGKGMSYGNGSFSFDTDEFGYFIVLSSIVPATGYFQGIDPMVQRVTKLDFWTPEFENLGVEPIKACNLFIPQYHVTMTSGDPYSQIFGFVPRYATYKAPTCMDRLTGNFRVPSLNSGFLNTGNTWHLMRTFDGLTDFNQDWSNVVHSPDFISGGADFSQYKRLFYEDGPDSPDNFTIIHNFEIAEYAPMKPLYDTYEFEDKGKKVTLETNGVKMN